MADDLELAWRFAEALKSAQPALADLVAADATFSALGIELAGRDQVMRHLTGTDSGRIYRDAEGIEIAPMDDATRIDLKAPAVAPYPGHILLVRFHDGRVASIRQQLILPARPAPRTDLRLTEDLKRMVDNALAERHPMLLAYVAPDGQPVLSFRGSTQIFSDRQLAIWVRNSGGGLAAAIARNPRVALMYRDEERKATFQFQGRARFATDERDRRRVYEAAHRVERDHDYARLGAALIIDLEAVEGYAGLSSAGQVGRVNMRAACLGG